MILVVDFGGQTAHLIKRRINDLGADAKLVNPQDIVSEIKKNNPSGIILSGGPSSVYQRGAPTISSNIFEHNIPILGICYGFMTISKLLGGKVIAGKKEYGPARLELGIMNYELGIIKGVKKSSTVWMSHGYEIVKLPKGFEILGLTSHVPFAFTANNKRNIFGVLFHPEVEHTEEGIKVLTNFLGICGVSGSAKNLNPDSIGVNIPSMVSEIRNTIGNGYVIGAISGGVDSTVAGTLCAKAIGKRFIPVYVENGLMREGTEKHVRKIFKKFDIVPKVINCEQEMLKRLKGVTDPEKKRTIIGNLYIEIFEREFEKLKKTKPVTHLLQGTIYSDVIESQGTKHSAKIKSHHNVGGLPSEMKLKLLEPVRFLYKDEVRTLGKKLGLPEDFIWKQPFPGPGYAIRIRGEVTKERLDKQKMADEIILDELEKANLLKKVFISFPVLTGAESTAVKGDGRFFGEVIAVRIVESNDVMTSTWARVPYDTLQRISSRIVNEVPHVSRVVYDITTKPPATMEWE